MSYKPFLEKSIFSNVNKIYKDDKVNNDNVFETWCQNIDDHFSTLISNDMKTLKRNANKEKGTMFEELVLELILNNVILSKYNIHAAWLFPNLPPDVKEYLRLGKKKADMGIDIIACTNPISFSNLGGKGKIKKVRWLAIQCKYIKKPLKQYYIKSDAKVTSNGNVNGLSGGNRNFPVRWAVNHKTLSTFISLCDTTGPEDEKLPFAWVKRIVITSAPSVRWQGDKSNIYQVVARGTFNKIKKHEWLALIGDEGHVLGEKNEEGEEKEKEKDEEKNEENEVNQEKEDINKEEKEKNEENKEDVKMDKIPENKEQDKNNEQGILERDDKPDEKIIEKIEKQNPKIQTGEDTEMYTSRNAWLDKLVKGV